jgi:thioester reductase-like protein
MASILEKLDHQGNLHPHKTLYEYLDLNGNTTDRYSYESFLCRSRVIAGHLRRDHRFETGDRLLLAYPPGLEMICAFFGCVRAGLIPVPVYPPSSHGFQAALYKMVHIAKDCGASGVLTSQGYYDSLKTNLARSGVSASGVDTDYISGLRWIVTEEFGTSGPGYDFAGDSEILFLQYTSGSTRDPRGVMVTHENILHNCPLVVDEASPVAVSWLPQYHDMGLIGYYLYSALKGGTTYGFSSTDFIQRPALWFDTITKYRASASAAPNFAYEYCLRAGRFSPESLEKCDLSSLKFLMAAAEPVRPGTYSRFLQTFQPYGLKPESFFVAYGLAENTLAVSHCGRNILSVNKNSIALGKARITAEVSEIDAASKLVSCGTPLREITVKIVDPEKHAPLPQGQIGEIWVSGKSKCRGYWGNPELTLRMFHARLVDDASHEDGYLRTGDMGFLHGGELYVCGRIKDMIIVRGQNYYPQDIEDIVENASGLIRKSCVAAFQINEDTEPALAIVAEVKNPKALPDALKIAAAVRNYLNVEVALISFIAPRAMPKTSSGKIMRHKAKQMWLEGKFTVLSSFSREKDGGAADDSEARGESAFDVLKARYGLTGTESHTLVEAGLDSLDLVVFMHEIKELLKDKGADLLARQVDISLIQRVSVAELFRLAEQLEKAPEEALEMVRHSLGAYRDELRRTEKALMSADRLMTFHPPVPLPVPEPPEARKILLTGGTGFIGPFLIKSLLEQTTAEIQVLIRASDEAQGMQRLRAAMESIGACGTGLCRMFEQRVKPVCGDLGQPGLSLPKDEWQRLADEIDTIYHNGATVNYLFNYDRMRDVNVVGTNEILKLAFEGRPKSFNYVSTTFIFGWAVKEVLYETDENSHMELLDFGYSQSKWAAEQVVLDARRRGLQARIFRPALVSPSVDGGGNNFDIAVRLLAFMVNHGVGVDALNQVSFVPADVAANNIVAISGSAGTANRTFHVVRDDYAHMLDTTDIITKFTGRQFEIFSLRDFVPEVIRRCGKDDLLFPLLDFLVGSVDNISSMEFKRYDSSNYMIARDASVYGVPDPSLDDTVAGILKFMQRKGIISAGMRALEAVAGGR